MLTATTQGLLYSSCCNSRLTQQHLAVKYTPKTWVTFILYKPQGPPYSQFILFTQPPEVCHKPLESEKPLDLVINHPLWLWLFPTGLKVHQIQCSTQSIINFWGFVNKLHVHVMRVSSDFIMTVFINSSVAPIYKDPKGTHSRKQLLDTVGPVLIV